jgi:CCR4-NOT transcription complex subunit 7/8
MDEEKEAIRNVWRDNLEEEMKRISSLLAEYRYVAMDTEFPGVVAKPVGTFTTTAIYNYQQLRFNVGILSLIQLGISLSNERGASPPGVSTWQFNLCFDTEQEMFAQESMQLLLEAGIDFERHKRDGVDPLVFADLLITSGLLAEPGITWISFHSSYDFAYLARLVSGTELASSITEFHQTLKSLFPHFYDIKYLMLFTKMLKGGLQDIADDLSVGRRGIQHQAGSDALLTLDVFFKMRDEIFPELLEDPRFKCKLFGLEGAGV